MQSEDTTLQLILDILCKVYEGEVWTVLYLSEYVAFKKIYYNYKVETAIIIFFSLFVTPFYLELRLNFAGVTMYSVLGQ